MRLLNAPINSPYFADDIPANTTPLNKSERIETDSINTLYDSTSIKIVTPPRNETIIVDSILGLHISIFDTINLKHVLIGFQEEQYQTITNTPYQHFNINIKPNGNGKNLILALVSYDSLGYTFNHVDTITLNVQSSKTLFWF